LGARFLDAALLSALYVKRPAIAKEGEFEKDSMVCAADCFRHAHGAGSSGIGAP
jgi:hypothetical protein